MAWDGWLDTSGQMAGCHEEFGEVKGVKVNKLPKTESSTKWC